MSDHEIPTKDFAIWRDKARSYLQQGFAPENTEWSNELMLFRESVKTIKPVTSPKVPADFFKLANLVSCARDDQKWTLLYRILFRLNHENPHLLKVSVDDDILRAQVLAKSVSRDIHKMHAFVRFKKVEIEGVETYVAWHQPEHQIIELGTPFFVRRFGDKPWSIFTPDASAHWNLKELTFTEGISQNEFHHRDAFDDIWTTYYRSIFNPARLKIKMMKAEMSPKYWASMPESAVIYDLIRNTPQRLQNMSEEVRHLAVVPENASWSELKEKAKACTACPLASRATQTVFGEGPLNASLMIVGEQPGDEEDLQGKAFIGPAGNILNQAFVAAGINRENIYITNAVKHFKWTTDKRNSKIRLHSKAKGSEMHACKPWLEAEIKAIKPKTILALGVTAGTAIYGRLIKIQEELGKTNLESPFAERILTSWHRSAILRANDENEKQLRFNQLVESLKQAHLQNI